MTVPPDFADQAAPAQPDARAAWTSAGRLVPLAAAAMGLSLGALLHLRGNAGADALTWGIATAAILALLLVGVIRGLRAGQYGLDILAALAMAACLVSGEYLAGNVVALMYAGGQVLEAYAGRRAQKEMTALLAHAPRTAIRDRDGTLTEVPAEAIHSGDLLLIRRGDIVPADGTLCDDDTRLDTSSLTGEAEPMRLRSGATVLSGSVNLGDAFRIRADHSASDSAYAAIVRLVAAAGRSRAPMSRLADRYALGFLALSLLIAGAAWLWSGDIRRAVAVLVIATPCPLILAVPVALIAGVSTAARSGLFVKGAAALEVLARVRTVILDKTGTLTMGRPAIADIETEAGWTAETLLRLAASLDQASSHPYAQVLIAEAQRRGLRLDPPAEVAETPGEGLRGRVGAHRVAIGAASFIDPGAATPARADGAGEIGVAIDGRLAGRIVLADLPREEAGRMIVGLRRLGIRRIVLATGDTKAAAARATQDFGFDQIHSGLTPADKIAVVGDWRGDGAVLMIGDGVNDAPALAAADIGVAMGLRGAAAAAEAADAMILVDSIEPLIGGIHVARAALTIARQSAIAGIALSVLGMIAAALGWLAPVEGALVQELIDVAVVLNALRVLLVRASP